MLKPLLEKLLIQPFLQRELLPECFRLDFTNPGNRHVGLFGNVSHSLVMCGRGGKQEFIIFSSLESKLKRIQIVPLGKGTQLGRERKRLSSNLDTDLTFFTDVSHVGGEPVGEIDGRMGDVSVSQKLSDLNPWRGS